MANQELRAAYAETLLELATKDERVVALEADLSSSMSTASLKDSLGDRYINVGIMEAQQVGVAAGLAVTGKIPFIHTFVPFATRRVYDQVFISLAYAQNHAIIVGSDVGISAEMNGGTHMSFEDLALMRAIPNISIYEVSDAEQFKQILVHCYETEGLHYIRTIRKSAPELPSIPSDLSQGMRVLAEGSAATIVTSGILLEDALEAAKELETEGITVNVVDLFRIKPLNEAKMLEIIGDGPVVTVDNHNVIGGIGSLMAEFVADNSPRKVARLGVKESFGQVGKMDYLKEDYGMTSKDIIAAVKSVVG